MERYILLVCGLCVRCEISHPNPYFNEKTNPKIKQKKEKDISYDLCEIRSRPYFDHFPIFCRCLSIQKWLISCFRGIFLILVVLFLGIYK